MEIYSKTKEYTLLQGNMIDMGEFVGGNTIDSIVTDPPYELNFMGKGWDNSGIAFQKETREKCLEALKPGGYLLAFGGSRTYHRIACAIEDAGFEVRDCIMWLYGSGFPKSMDIEKAINKVDGVEFISKPASGVGFMNTDNDGYHNTINQLEQVGESSERAKQRAGWGTALKPSYEPIIVARKPCEGSCTDNVIKYGVGGINIDGCRVGGEGGRFPANTIFTYDEKDFEEVCGGLLSNNEYRYYYCAKASKKDRDEGLENFEIKGAKELLNREENSDGASWNGKYSSGNAFAGSGAPKKNIHPTVKPTDLMQYLVRLVTPNGGTVLDPFNGSGSTGKAVMYENKDRNKNYKYIGIELTEEYLPIAKARIEYVIEKGGELREQTLF